MPIRIHIADDEELARQLLREFLAKIPEAEIIGESGDGFSAVKCINDDRPDVIFLDVQMPKLNGFEVLELLDTPEEARLPVVIFTTAYDQYALRAFDANAVDYLLKPFSQERFLTAWKRACQQLRLHRLSAENAGQDEAQTPTAAASAAPAPAELARQARTQPLTRLVVKDGGRIALIPLEQLIAVEAQDDYVALHTAEKCLLKKQTIGSLEAGLDPASFVRVHRGWIVSLSAISRLEPMGRERYVLLLQDGRRIPVSRSGYERLRGLWGA